MAKLELLIERDGNHILGNFWRVVAYEGESRLGEKIYAGYTKREAVSLAREYFNRLSTLVGRLVILSRGDCGRG
jgi:hypothetical protein